jgi:hypothetical protein
MAIQGKGVDRIYELLDQGYDRDDMILMFVKYQSNSELQDMLESNELWDEGNEA